MRSADSASMRLEFREYRVDIEIHTEYVPCVFSHVAIYTDHILIQTCAVAKNSIQEPQEPRRKRLTISPGSHDNIKVQDPKYKGSHEKNALAKSKIHRIRLQTWWTRSFKKIRRIQTSNFLNKIQDPQEPVKTFQDP